MGFGIKSVIEKANRRKKVEDFVVKYGRGDKGVSDDQKQARIDKLLGDQKHKKGAMKPIKISSVKKDDPLENENLDEFPNDIRSETGQHKILNCVCDDSGGITIQGIIQDGNEHDRATRKTYSVDIPNDIEQAKLENKQLIQNKLKEVSDRTMKIHDEEGILDEMLESDIIDTDPDKDTQM